jgi:hypothetical protein
MSKLKCCRRKNKSCGSLISNDLSQYGGEMGIMAGVLSNTYENGCNILIIYNSLEPDPPGFVEVKYGLLLKNFMRCEGNKNIFKNVEPTINKDIYDDYIYSDFQKYLDSLDSNPQNSPEDEILYDKFKAIFKQFIVESKCDKIKISYLNMDKNDMDDYKLSLMINENKYDLLLNLMLGGRGNQGYLGETAFSGIPLPDKCFYYPPAANKTIIYYSLDSGETWLSVKLFNADINVRKLTKVELIAKLNQILGNVIPDYRILFLAQNIAGHINHKTFTMQMQISKISPNIPVQQKDKISISRFRIKTPDNLLCFAKNMVYQIRDENIVNKFDADNGFLYENLGTLQFQNFINLTANNTITIHLFLYSVVMHEFMHVLAFKHTHQINSADNPCTDAGWAECCRSETNYFRLNFLRDGPIAIEEFDRSSIMTYSLGPEDNVNIPGESGTFFYRNFILSDTDKRNLQQFYKRPVPPPPPGFLQLVNKLNETDIQSENKIVKFLSDNLLIILFFTLIIIFLIFKFILNK